MSEQGQQSQQEQQGQQSQQEQQKAPAEVSAAFEAWVRGVGRLSAEHGLQAVVVAAVAPAPGGFGPSSVHALSWTHGQPPAEWRQGAAESLAKVAVQAAGALSAAPKAATANAPAEGGDAPEVKAEDAAPAAA